MNEIKSYSYRVERVDQGLDLMELIYQSPDLPDVLVGAPLPRGTQTVEDIARMYVPMVHWNKILNPIVDVAVGTTGTVEIVLPEAIASNLPISILTATNTSTVITSDI
jgi:hypothetical protein